MKTTIFLRSQNPITDSRLQRYLKILNQNQLNYQVLGWNRDGKSIQNLTNQKLYQKISPIGGGMANITSLITWNIFLLKKLFNYRKTFTHIHAVDFDTCIPAYIIAKTFRKKLIFDVYDKYTDSRTIPRQIIPVINRIEKKICTSADTLILPDICRVEQLQLPISDIKKMLIFENIPSTKLNRNKIADDAAIHLSYVGILEAKNRGLENLVNVVANYPHIILTIAGTGPLENFIENASKAYPNIYFHGQVDSLSALAIMNNSHIIVGMYYKTIKNHLYASPNKYYEHLMLGKALLTTQGTPPGNKVLEFQTGYVIGENAEDIDKFLKSLDTNELKICSDNAAALWDSKYLDYYQAIANDYVKT